MRMRGRSSEFYGENPGLHATLCLNSLLLFPEMTLSLIPSVSLATLSKVVACIAQRNLTNE
jgi:hypothetical protein